MVIQVPHGSPLRWSQHPDYAPAKAGDPAAAVRFVDAVVSQAGLERLRLLIGGRRPIIAAAHAEEAGGRNALPERYAFLLSRRFGLPLDVEIVQANRPRRTG